MTHNAELVRVLLLLLSKDIRVKYTEHDNISRTRKGHAAVPQFADPKYMYSCITLHHNHISYVLPECMIASLWYNANYMTLWENRQLLNQHKVRMVQSDDIWFGIRHKPAGRKLANQHFFDKTGRWILTQSIISAMQSQNLLSCIYEL